jgi:hypothetical protein
VALLMFAKAILSLALFSRTKNKRERSFLWVVLYIKQATFAQVILSILFETEKQIMVSIIVNYIICASGIFILFLIKTKMLAPPHLLQPHHNERPTSSLGRLFNDEQLQAKLVVFVFFYFTASLVGMPGTFGFYNSYSLLLSFLKAENTNLALYYFILFAAQILIMIKIAYFTILKHEHTNDALLVAAATASYAIFHAEERHGAGNLIGEAGLVGGEKYCGEHHGFFGKKIAVLFVCILVGTLIALTTSPMKILFMQA